LSWVRAIIQHEGRCALGTIRWAGKIAVVDAVAQYESVEAINAAVAKLDCRRQG
jgi:hypothetical protein